MKRKIVVTSLWANVNVIDTLEYCLNDSAPISHMWLGA